MRFVDSHDRLDELLVERAVAGLDPSDERELLQLLGGRADLSADLYDGAVASVHVALLDRRTMTLPESLQKRLERDVETFCNGLGRHSGSAPVPPRPSAIAPDAAPARPVERSWIAAPWPGWLAAAAALLIAFLVWGPRTDVAGDPASPGDLLERAPDAVVVDWASTEDPLSRGVSGEVVWSDELQRGFMRFRGLARNDPSQEQYQLWIFDRDHPAETPVDGGVFDVDQSGEVVVPIDAKLAVAEPSLFAVTLERPGGVVVSKRERLVLAAPVN